MLFRLNHSQGPEDTLTTTQQSHGAPAPAQAQDPTSAPGLPAPAALCHGLTHSMMSQLVLGSAVTVFS